MYVLLYDLNLTIYIYIYIISGNINLIGILNENNQYIKIFWVSIFIYRVIYHT